MGPSDIFDIFCYKVWTKQSVYFTKRFRILLLCSAHITRACKTFHTSLFNFYHLWNQAASLHLKHEEVLKGVGGFVWGEQTAEVGRFEHGVTLVPYHTWEHRIGWKTKNGANWQQTLTVTSELDTCKLQTCWSLGRLGHHWDSEFCLKRCIRKCVTPPPPPIKYIMAGFLHSAVSGSASWWLRGTSN